ncbi:uncharacterized protein LOC122251065 [Penaeus japonicus]|uniref:uncharacterized protein LOC122251065 n=1 Tax=Penaeus japonicus TaxID=27405 RepID=UPI001C71168B|nr:uncharacterized protein LOC122251065 [Penaeus japonicus]XP_042868714.1 uncharacterized protein LOC122251065 [Penaeus japonicus]XP_042868715.1 uncharacterized protein LOC122251065 [Penaeus japonicus]XP_042868716.1 uncharacterized protein LOC122251065 [Penaeus japonicus]
MLGPPLPAAKELPATCKKATLTRAPLGGSDNTCDPEGSDEHVAQQSHQERDGQEGMKTPEGKAQAGDETSTTAAGGAQRNRPEEEEEEEEEEGVLAGGRPSRLVKLMSCITPGDIALYFSSFAPSLPSSVSRPSSLSLSPSYNPPPAASASSFPVVLVLQKMLAVLVVVTSILALITSVPGAQAEGTDKGKFGFALEVIQYLRSYDLMFIGKVLLGCHLLSLVLFLGLSPLFAFLPRRLVSLDPGKSNRARCRPPPRRRARTCGVIKRIFSN